MIPAGVAFVSAGLLSLALPGRERLVKAAVVFLAFWSLASWLLRGGGAQGGFSPEALALWLFLGLHLFLVWTPAQLGRGAAVIVRPFAGRGRAALLGLSLTALAKAVPGVLADAALARRSLGRLRGLGVRRRMALWGRAVFRLTFRRAAGLGRTLAKRQRDLG
jgi:hypothetical protein